MKRIVAFALTALTLACCVACSSTTYRDDVTAETVVAAAIAAIGVEDDYMDGTLNYFDSYFEGEDGAQSVTDARMMFHRVETNVNQIGVFRVADAEAVDDVEQLTQEYVEGQKEHLRSFAQNYSPADMTKIDNADVVVKGNYIIYYILSPEDESAALDAVDAVLIP